MSIGVGQRRSLRDFLQPQMPQLPFHAGQPAADLAQRVGPAQLAEQHRDELAPAGKSTGMALGPMIPNRRLKFQSRK